MPVNPIGIDLDGSVVHVRACTLLNFNDNCVSTLVDPVTCIRAACLNLVAPRWAPKDAAIYTHASSELLLEDSTIRDAVHGLRAAGGGPTKVERCLVRHVGHGIVSLDDDTHVEDSEFEETSVVLAASHGTVKGNRFDDSVVWITGRRATDNQVKQNCFFNMACSQPVSLIDSCGNKINGNNWQDGTAPIPEVVEIASLLLVFDCPSGSQNTITSFGVGGSPPGTCPQ